MLALVSTLRRQPAAGRLDRQPDRRRPGAQAAASHIDWKQHARDRHPGDAGHAGAGVGLAALKRAAIMRGPMADAPCFPERRADAGGAPPVGAVPGAGRRRLGQDARHRAQDRAAAAEPASSPKHIAAITFTNKAAAEMRERAKALVGARAAKDLAISTFHSLGVRMLRSDGEKVGPEGAVLHPRQRRRARRAARRRRLQRQRAGAALAVGHQPVEEPGPGRRRRRRRRGQRRRARRRARDAASTSSAWRPSRRSTSTT